MGNSGSQSTPQELTNDLWVKTPAKETSTIVQDSPSPTPISTTDTLAPTSSSKPSKETPQEKAARKAAKQERKERRRRNREERLRREALAEAGPSHQQLLSPSIAENDDASETCSPSTATTARSSAKGRSRAHRPSPLPNMDPDYAIDPSLREAEGTVHTAPGSGEQTENGQQAPVASMQSTIMQDPEYKNMLPLIRAAERAGPLTALSESQSGQSYAPARSNGHLPSGTNIDQQGKVGKKGKKRGRPRKKTGTDADADGPSQAGAQSQDSIDGGTESQKDGLDASSGTANGVVDSSPKVKKQKLRKRAAPAEEEEVENADESEPPKKKRKSEVEVDETGLTEKERELREEGPLSKLEWRKVEEIIERFKKEHKIEQTKVNELIQSTKRAQGDQTKDLWTLLYAALDHRKHVAVMRACRRRFNNFEVRGKWSKEDEDLLRQAYADSPGRWVKIGSVLGRMPEDCRDRWRNYLSCGDQRRIDDWTSKEEKLLRASVQDCAEALKQDAKAKAKEEGHAFREQDWESQVNFNVVSEKMDFTRSRLQCYTHWRVMQNRDPSITGSTRKSEGASNRQGRALANFKKMKPGDKYQILSQIADTQAKEDEEIPWKQIARENRQGRWTTRDRKETFIKLKSELAGDIETLTEALDVMLEYFRSTYPDQLDEVTPPEEEKQAEAGQFEASGYESAPPFYKGDGSVIDEDQTAENHDQTATLRQDQSAAVSHLESTLVPRVCVTPITSAKKVKKPRGKKASKKSSETITEQDEENAAQGYTIENYEEERKAAAQQLGALAADGAATLAQHLQNASTAMLHNPYEPAQPVVRGEAEDIVDVDMDAQTQAMQAAEAMQELVQSEALEEAPLPENSMTIDEGEERDEAVLHLSSAPKKPKRARKGKGGREGRSEPPSSEIDGFPWKLKRRKGGTS